MLGYSMALGTTVDLTAVRALAAALLGVEDNADGPLVSGGLQVLVTPVDEPLASEVYSDLLGLPATARVLMSVDNKVDDDDYLRANRAMLITAAQLAVQTDAEACLTFQLDHALMRRRSGVLYLYDWCTDWFEPEVQTQLPQPYTVAPDEGILQ